MTVFHLFLAALPFFLGLLVLLAVFRHPGADSLTRRMGGIFATPLLILALSPRLTLGAAAPPDAVAGYLAIVGGGLVIIVLLWGRSDLE